MLLGQCLVLPAENLVVYNEQSIRLEPKVMQVLMVLGENVGNSVSRQQLIDDAWSGRSITDDAITRCISILRRLFDKQLAVPISIETVSKVGYRLELGEQKTHFKASSIINLAFVAAILLIVVAILLLNTKTQAPEQYRLERLLVSDKAERQAAFSNDDELLAYTIAAGPGQRDLYIRELQGDGVSKLTEETGISHQPVFSPDSTRIAFARGKPQGDCEILSISIYGGRETRHGSCEPGGVSDLEWTPDGASLIYVDRPRNAHAGTLKQIDLASGETRVLINNEMGVDDMALSPDGKSLAITRYRALGVEDLSWRPLNSDAPFQQVTHDKLKIHGIAWSPDNRRLYFSSNRLGPFQLWSVDRDGTDLRLIPEALHGGDAIALSMLGVIALERWTERSEIIRKEFDPTFSRSVLIPDKGVNWDARLSVDGKHLAFVSDRSGAAEIWIQNKTETYKLTNYQGPWVLSPRWSPVANKLTFVVPLDGRYQLQVLDVDTQQVEKIESLPNAFSPSWSDDGASIVIAVEEMGQWNLHQFNLADQSAQQLTHHGGKRGQIDDSDDWLYFSKADQAGIWRKSLNEDAEEVLLTEKLAPVDWNNWQLLDNTLYYVTRGENSKPQLWGMDTLTLEATFVTELDKLLYFSGINVTPDHDAVLYSRITEEDADINLLYPQ